MNTYKATFKENKNESYWDNKPLLIVAASFGNAEDKALNSEERRGRELISIHLFGETTKKPDVFELRER